MSSIELFRRALAKTIKLQASYSWSKPLQSVVEQLQYLIEEETGKERDHSKIAQINIGIIAAREIEDMDADVANELHKVADSVRNSGRNGS